MLVIRLKQQDVLSLLPRQAWDMPVIIHAVVIGRASATLPIDRVRYRGMHGLVRALS